MHHIFLMLFLFGAIGYACSGHHHHHHHDDY
jgi:hypothetical protein